MRKENADNISGEKEKQNKLLDENISHISILGKAKVLILAQHLLWNHSPLSDMQNALSL